MNSLNNHHTFSGRAIGLVTLAWLAGGLLSSAYAGPGAAYWQSLNQRLNAQSTPAPVAQSATKPAEGRCAGSHVVAVTEVRNAWANGRGPLQVVQVGTKNVCAVCGGTTAVMKKSRANGRGPMVAAEAPAEHDCDAGCGNSAMHM